MFGFSKERQAILHLTWIAFFLLFVAWFNMAPFNTTLMGVMGLTQEQINILMICNVALTIPARTMIGSLVDRFGPRIIFIWILVFSSLVCFQFAIADDFLELLVARLLMGIVGAGFVVGIKMIGEWFPPDRMGIAQGLYAGWGNFGAAAAAFSLPVIAAAFPVESGWRVATGFSGFLCLVWAFVFARYAKDSPQGNGNFTVSLAKTLEVTSRKDMLMLILLLAPIYGAIIATVWKLSGHPLPLLPTASSIFIYSLILSMYVYHIFKTTEFNLPRLPGSFHPRHFYEFRQIVILSLVYALTFGSELAVISMFPEYLENTFGLSVAGAGILGSSFAIMNLVTRPSGGWISDLIGRRRSMFIMVLGASVGYLMMGRITAQWPLWQVIALAVTCSIFLQAGNGACFAMVPLIRKDLTGQMAGLAGAYGSVGAIAFLLVFSFVDSQTFFKIICLYGIVVLFSLLFLKSFQDVHHSFLETKS